MRALRVAGDLEVRGLRGALDDTPIRARIRRQLPVDRVPDISSGTIVALRGYWNTSPCRS